MKVGVAFLPIAIVGFLFHKQIKSLFTVPIVATMFILGGVMFFIVEYLYKKHPPTITDLNKISYRQALFIGISQILAVIPGTSRAGATITSGMLGKVDRTISAEFSFLLGIPVLGAASLFDIVKHYDQFNSSNIIALLVGGSVAFIMAYITIKLFLHFLKNFTFISFGIYRIIIGILLLLFFWK
jgi:undecaprenyl-diphosphatase